MIIFYRCAGESKANTNGKLLLDEKKKNKQLKKEIREKKKENFALQERVNALSKRMKTIHLIIYGII